MLLRACFDRVLVETVGVGQSETEIADCADLVVLCVQPASGDGLQFMKAGVMETPGPRAGDQGRPRRPGAPRRRRRARRAVDRRRRPAEVALVSAQSGDGVAAAVDRIEARLGRPEFEAALPARRRAQGRAWAESRLAESVGQLGLAALAPRLDAQGAPFAAVADPDREGPGGAS